MCLSIPVRPFVWAASSIRRHDRAAVIAFDHGVHLGVIPGVTNPGAMLETAGRGRRGCVSGRAGYGAELCQRLRRARRAGSDHAHGLDEPLAQPGVARIGGGARAADRVGGRRGPARRGCGAGLYVHRLRRPRRRGAAGRGRGARRAGLRTAGDRLHHRADGARAARRAGHIPRRTTSRWARGWPANWARMCSRPITAATQPIVPSRSSTRRFARC